MTRTSEGDPLALDTLCEEIVRAVTSYLCDAGAGPRATPRSRP
jgi:hypothetical protein